MQQQRNRTKYGSLKTYALAAIELPGPLWLFGVYVILDCSAWLNTLWIETLDRNSVSWNWTTALIQVKTLCFHLFQIAILHGLILRRPYAFPLTAWFAGIQFALCGLAFMNILRTASFFIPFQYGTLSATILSIIIKGTLWMLLLRYLETSATQARIFCPENRHVAKKYILLLLVLHIF